ncbi:hypothetical protein B5S28_g418 [[Candida] boidinii]|nr:hypothetical protein B5S28_g418 [[Candida] boidinii]OWB76828.1 hypothetical protein B5S32_g984 [[Candida] boidinii]
MLIIGLGRSLKVTNRIRHSCFLNNFKLFYSTVVEQNNIINNNNNNNDTNITFQNVENGSEKPRINPVGIQHLSNGLQNQLFPNSDDTETNSKINASKIQLVKLAHEYLKNNDLLGKKCSINDPINFKLPTLQGENLSEHFYRLGLNDSKNYLNLINNLLNLESNKILINKKQIVKPKKSATQIEKEKNKINFEKFPTLPKNWLFKSGWTRYEEGKKPESVPYPLEDELVFDVETMYKISKFPTLATALTSKAWYCWVSPFLTKESNTPEYHLIPLNTQEREKIIVGHNVSYDRARIKEEYNINMSKAFFMDTMSLHIAVNGMCSRQRSTWIKYNKNVNSLDSSAMENLKNIEKFKENLEDSELKNLINNDILIEDQLNDNDTESSLKDDPWLKTSSLNSLAHVANLHCGIKLEKSIRDDFATLDPNTVRKDFQKLTNYCANDVIATFEIFKKIYPDFKEIIPHPINFSALRHINQSFLPTTRNWDNYIENTEDIYQNSANEINEKLYELCNETVKLKDDPSKPWESDPWLSQLDWTIQPVKLTKKGVPYKNQKLPGYPEWYKQLMVKNELKLTIKTRISSLLLKLAWEGKPIYWIESKGWCFITDKNETDLFINKNYSNLDNNELLKLNDPNSSTYNPEIIDLIYSKNKAFFKIPHEDGPNARVTCLFSKAFVSHFESGLLSSDNETAKNALQLSVSNSYWTSSRERIISQFVVYNDDKHIINQNLADNKISNELEEVSSESKKLNSELEESVVELKEEITSAKKSEKSKALNKVEIEENNDIDSFTTEEAKTANSIKSVKLTNSPNSSTETSINKDLTFGIGAKMGIIIPQIVPMGTITRRAVEKTWLTASNAKKNRLGSELKAMVQAPPGYKFVGADVDSEELWIASLVGDSVFHLHGGTAIGWMTLEGKKSEGTDLHSKTADILNISRNEAKVFNYGRIYGAGAKFAVTLLKKFNPSITDKEAKETAKRLYAATKGKNDVLNGKKIWYGGSESIVFNRLEKIAEQENPKTPVLGAGITSALQKNNLNSNTFLPSRINWAIQSSGVDYLHLLLVSMSYLTKIYNIDARLCITVHDEIRYLVKEEDQYKVAMLLQISNLWTRAMFCHQLGIDEVPQTCAFFSAVDIDHVLRKEVDLDCITPSHPNPIPHGESLDIYQLLEKPEIQEFLRSHDNEKDEDLKKIFSKISKLSKPNELLDKNLDNITKNFLIKLQISTNSKDFKKIKKIFLNELDISKNELFLKDLNESDKKFRENSKNNKIKDFEKEREPIYLNSTFGDINLDFNEMVEKINEFPSDFPIKKVIKTPSKSSSQSSKSTSSKTVKSISVKTKTLSKNATNNKSVSTKKLSTTSKMTGNSIASSSKTLKPSTTTSTKGKKTTKTTKTTSNKAKNLKNDSKALNTSTKDLVDINTTTNENITNFNSVVNNSISSSSNSNKTSFTNVTNSDLNDTKNSSISNSNNRSNNSKDSLFKEKLLYSTPNSISPSYKMNFQPTATNNSKAFSTSKSSYNSKTYNTIFPKREGANHKPKYIQGKSKGSWSALSYRPTYQEYLEMKRPPIFTKK